MRIGLDFDNTIVCYDKVFHSVASTMATLPADLPATKVAVRDHLRRMNREDDWTEIQGLVYTTHILEADPFPGVTSFLQWARSAGVEVAIVSQKTIFPFRGARSNLHHAARGWIANRLQEAGTPLVNPERVFFELTKREKLARIASLDCVYFIDDLPEILLDPEFPHTVSPILFDTTGASKPARPLSTMMNWDDIRSFFEAA